MKKKMTIISLLMLLILFVILLFINISNSHKVAVLGYHSVMPKKINTSGDNLVVDLEKFEKELIILKKMGYKTLTLDEFYCWKNRKCNQPQKSVLITFDDGYKNNYDYAYNLLKKYNMNAVVFCVGSYIMGDGNLHMNMETIQKVREEYPNIEIASHSYNLHFHSDKTYDEVVEDAQKMSKIVETNYYAYPFGDYNDDYINALKDSGFNMAFTFGPGKEHRKADISDSNFTVPRLNISNDMSYLKFVLRLFLPI